MNLVNIIFKFVSGKRNLIIPRGINKHDKIIVFSTKMEIDVIPIINTIINDMKCMLIGSILGIRNRPITTNI